MTKDQKLTGMILAAGKGSRLKELGETTPKALLKLESGTFLELILKKFKTLGISEVIINLHHLGEKIEEFIQENNNFGLDIKFSREEELLGTGGAIKHAYKYLRDSKNVLLHNCDIYTDFDLPLLINAHAESNSDVTLAIQKRETQRFLAFSDDMGLVGWKNVDTGRENIVTDLNYKLFGFSCIHLISNRTLKYISEYPEDNFSIITAYLEALKTGFEIRGYDIHSAYWVDVGTQDRLSKLKEELSDGKRLS